MRQRANDFTGISVLSAVSPQAEMYHMGLNVVELLMLVFPLSVLTPKNADLREGGLANVSILGCQSVLFHIRFYFLLWLPIIPLWVPSVFHRWIRIGDPLHWIKVCTHRGICAGGASSTL